jgi:hypothetical protein
VRITTQIVAVLEQKAVDEYMRRDSVSYRRPQPGQREMNKRNLHIQQLSAENRPDKNPYQWAIRDRSRPEAGDLQVFATRKEARNALKSLKTQSASAA